MNVRVLSIILLLLISACSDQDKPFSTDQSLPPAVTQAVDYHSDVRPIVEQKCIACHGCFDAPCQLKLESAAGLLRGASKKQAYDGTRTKAAAPTRLWTDAHTEQQWRDLGFHSVLQPEDDLAPLLYRMLSLGKSNRFAPNSKLPDDIDIGIRRSHSCPSVDEFSDYAQAHPHGGMPFAIAGLSDQEFSLIRGWLAQGAKVSARNVQINQAEQRHIDRIEQYFNQRDLKKQLVARWLYEHLYLAHLYFERDKNPQNYFQLVRSYTPPGEPIDIVATRLPNSAPDGKFYYRVRPVEGSIVHKRHITFLFNADLQKRIEQLFYAQEWTLDKLPDYSYKNRSNPFTTFRAIPARARYQFLLDHAEYFTRTFVRGPVCRGQIATDVIRDQFWVMYQDPEHDLFITNPSYREKVIPLLGLPGQDDKLIEAPENWSDYKAKRNQYLEVRNQHYSAMPVSVSSLESIWDGEGHNENALLTVFRHFDSASVETGWIGQMPITLWWMDYPLFERTYYELVVNFDVFGNVAHQLQTRLYFDLIRNGAEHNFLRLLPKAERSDVLADWYQDMGAIKTLFSYAPIDTDSDTGIEYKTQLFKQELIDKIFQRLQKVNAMPKDHLNRCGDACDRAGQSEWVLEVDRVLAALSKVPFSEKTGLLFLPEMTFLRVINDEGERAVYTLIRNRYHDNVAFLLGESLRYQPSKDTLTIYPGIIGSYPNFMFNVRADELAQFKNKLLAAEKKKLFDDLTARWGVRRTHPQFWDILHDVSAWHAQQNPIEAGIFDVNRYKNL